MDSIVAHPGTVSALSIGWRDHRQSKVRSRICGHRHYVSVITTSGIAAANQHSSCSNHIFSCLCSDCDNGCSVHLPFHFPAVKGDAHCWIFAEELAEEPCKVVVYLGNVRSLREQSIPIQLDCIIIRNSIIYICKKP